MFLYGCETWILDSKEAGLIERLDLWALKKMFGLPPTTPTPAIRYVTGTMFTDIAIKKKQLIYLKHLLQKDNSYWAKDSLYTLRSNDTWWAKNIVKTLEQWDLEQNWDIIASKSTAAWAREVEQAAEKQNKSRLFDICHSKQRGTSRIKTKTRSIAEVVQLDTYKRLPLPILDQLTTIQTRAFIMGRYGMLDCKNNFSMGYGGKMCAECNTLDNEAHRINVCVNFRDVNRCDKVDKIDFEKIYSDEMDEVITVVNAILTIWDLYHGKNTIRRIAEQL